MFTISSFFYQTSYFINDQIAQIVRFFVLVLISLIVLLLRLGSNSFCFDTSPSIPQVYVALVLILFFIKINKGLWEDTDYPCVIICGSISLSHVFASFNFLHFYLESKYIINLKIVKFRVIITYDIYKTVIYNHIFNKL